MRRSLLAIMVAATLLLAACGDSDDDGDDASADTTEAGASPTTAAPAETTAAPAETTEPMTDTTAGGGAAGEASNIQAPGECGMGTGEAASGEPIKIGGIATNVPGIDFTWITGMTAAYFECVNENGGINGRPIEYIVEEEQIDPQQIAGLAAKLAEEDQVLGFVGNTSIIDCSVNADYYTQQGYSLIIAGVDHACFTNATYSAVNMGPYYSSLGGAQAAIRAGATGTMVIVTPNIPGVELINAGVVAFAEENGLEGISITEDVPIADPATLAQRLVQEAGEGGAVVLDFTGPAVLPLLQAIDQQGLTDTVIWASSTPPNDPSVAEALSPNWNDKFLINAEFNPLDSGMPDQNHMNEIREQYAPDINLSSFGQMGYLAGRIATDALLGIEGDITKESVNEAFRGVTNFVTDILCRPWYFDSTLSGNVSNNVDITVVPRDGVMVQSEDCFEIADLPTPENLLAEIREKEQELGLNTAQ